MKSIVLILLALLIFIIGLFICDDTETKLDFTAAVGKYKSNYRNGDERLELRLDSTYVYEIKRNNGQHFNSVGKWKLSEKLEDNYRVMIILYNWPEPIFKRYSKSKDEHVNIQKDSLRVNLTPDTIYRIQEYKVEFLADIIALKSMFVIRRSFDEYELDFIKIE